MTFHVHIHNHFNDTKLDHIMASIAQLSQKVDQLQAALDSEQQEIADAIAQLNQTISELQAIVSDGGTTEERQAIADKLDAITSDLQGTINATPNPEPSPDNGE
jgi:ABC-type transporter Mla subunit MlaD